MTADTTTAAPQRAEITGELLTTAELRTGAGEPFPVRMVRPGTDLAIVAEVSRQADQWERIAAEYGDLVKAGRLPEDVAFRAHFAGDVLFFAGTQLTTAFSREVILALHGESEVVGVTLYHVDGEKAALSWVAVHPRFLAGAPTPTAEQVRGIGTSMVCVAAEQILATGATTIELSPLDDAAERFWRARGFEPIGGGDLAVSGRPAVEELGATCTREPDDPARTDELCICGTYESLRDFRLPALREVMPARSR